MKNKITWESVRLWWEDTKLWAEIVFLAGFPVGAGLVYPALYMFLMYASPDANSDGAFTISDFWAGAWNAFSYAGAGLIDLVGGETWWRFLEIDRQRPDGIIFQVLCCVGWWICGSVVVALFARTRSPD